MRKSRQKKREAEAAAAQGASPPGEELRPLDGEPPSYLLSRSWREYHEAERARLKVEELVEESAARVRRGLARAGIRIRDAFLRVPDRLAPLLAAAAGDRARIRELLDRELRDVLASLARLEVQTDEDLGGEVVDQGSDEEEAPKPVRKRGTRKR